jgi:Zn-dependent protease with chaperone function
MKWKRGTGHFGFALVILATTAAMASGQTVVRPGFNIFSVDQDVEIGTQSALQAEHQFPMMSDAGAQRLVSSLGARLAAQAPGAKFNYQFKVANLSDANAFALPGGFVYVNRGLLDVVRSEGELAGVMAHEIAHVALRHGTNQASKAYLADAGLGVLGGLFGGPSSESTEQIVNAIGGFGMNTLFLKFSRSMESQADVVGAQIMARAGYDPIQMVKFFAFLEQKAGSNPSKFATFMSTHPAPANREARLRQESKLIGTVPRKAPIGTLASVQKQLRRYPEASAAAQFAATSSPSGGSTTANGAGLSIEAPSSRYRVFVQSNGNFQIEQPDNWTANTTEGAYGVTLLPRGGLVRGLGGRDNIAYGVIVAHYLPFDGALSNSAIGSSFTDPQGSYPGTTSLEQASSDIVGQIQQANPHLSRVDGSDKRSTLSGENSLSVRLAGRSSATGRSEEVTVVTRSLADDHIVYMLLIAPGDEYAALEPTFSHIVRSLRVNETATHN